MPTSDGYYEIWKCSHTIEHLRHQYHTSALSNEVHNVVLAQGAQKLSAKVKMLSLFYYWKLHFQTLIAGNFWAPWAEIKLYTSFESADMRYWCLSTSGHNGLDTLANCNKVELDKLWNHIVKLIWNRRKNYFSSPLLRIIAFLRFLLYKIMLELTWFRGQFTKVSTLESD